MYRRLWHASICSWIDAFDRSSEIVFVNIRRNAANTKPDQVAHLLYQQSAKCACAVRDIFFSVAVLPNNMAKKCTTNKCLLLSYGVHIP